MNEMKISMLELMMNLLKLFAGNEMRATELERRIIALKWTLAHETLSTCSARRINESIEKFEVELDYLITTGQMEMEALS